MVVVVVVMMMMMQAHPVAVAFVLKMLLEISPI
jgi:hypothetical protein